MELYGVVVIAAARPRLLPKLVRRGWTQGQACRLQRRCGLYLFAQMLMPSNTTHWRVYVCMRVWPSARGCVLPVRRSVCLRVYVSVLTTIQHRNRRQASGRAICTSRLCSAVRWWTYLRRQPADVWKTLCWQVCRVRTCVRASGCAIVFDYFHML